ncbi:MAG: tRNA lysidine(34) synthetase TilS [Coriobacteriales bacterium]|nr:tRNA lysidine(34) synthetase TilS [Coriobacteriales bacterium]
MTDTVSRTLAQHRMLPDDQRAPLLLMVSGGSDSVALARLLVQLFGAEKGQPQTPPDGTERGHQAGAVQGQPAGTVQGQPAAAARPLKIFHLNHQLRGEDSEADERFVLALAAELGLPCATRRVELATLAASQGAAGNVEQLGRQLRYQLAGEVLDELCAQAAVPPSAGRIVVAHTRDDRVETFLMRVIKGAGQGALAGIPHVNGRVIRPLLDCTREQLRDWLVARACSVSPSSAAGSRLWREDASNADTRYFRAFIRHKVLPLLEEQNPDLLATAARTMDLLADEDAYLAAQAAELLTAHGRVDGDLLPGSAARMELAGELFSAHPVLVRRAVKLACEAVMPPDARLTQWHITNIAQAGGHIGFATDIPGDVTVRNDNGILVIRQKTAAEQPRHDPRSDNRQDSRPDSRPNQRGRQQPDAPRPE